MFVTMFLSHPRYSNCVRYLDVAFHLTVHNIKEYVAMVTDEIQLLRFCMLCII